MAKREVGVGDGRLDAAAAVAHGAGDGAGALGADGQRARVRDAGDRAAAGTDRHHVDHRQADGPAADAAVGGEAGLAAVDERDVGGGAADVDADEVGVAGGGADVGRADGAGGRAGEGGLHGGATHVARAGDAAARFHEEQRCVDAALGHARVEALHVGGDDRHDRGVEDGGHAALVLAEDRQHLARQRQQRAGDLLGEDLGDAALVGGVGVAVQQHDGDGADALRLDGAGGVAHGGLVEGRELAPVRPDAAGDLEDVLGRHGALGLHPGEQAGAARHVLAADLQHVLEAGRGDERGAGALALEDQVGGDGGAVQDAGDVGAGEARRPSRPRRCRCRSLARDRSGSTASWRSRRGRWRGRAG